MSEKKIKDLDFLYTKVDEKKHGINIAVKREFAIKIRSEAMKDRLTYSEYLEILFKKLDEAKDNKDESYVNVVGKLVALYHSSI